MKKLKKVIIPIAGLGTRMLPATKEIPKEMLTIVDKPIIQIVVEEVIKAGFEEIIFITNSKKNSVENHFNRNVKLEKVLFKNKKKDLLKKLELINNLKVNFENVFQKQPKGLGHAILLAKSLVGNDPFGVVLPDMILESSLKSNNFSLMKKYYENDSISSILLGEALKSDISNYGIAKVKRIKKRSKVIIERIIEKPSLSKAPSNLFAVGRYIFENRFFSYLEKVKPDMNNEIQLTDAIDLFLKDKNKVFGFISQGNIFDCGTPLGFVSANLAFAKNNSVI